MGHSAQELGTGVIPMKVVSLLIINRQIVESNKQLVIDTQLDFMYTTPNLLTGYEKNGKGGG